MSVHASEAYKGAHPGLQGDHSLSSLPFLPLSLCHPFFLIIVFFSASIAFTFVLSLSGIAVRSAPIAQRADIVPQACTGPNGTGTCTPLNVASPQPTPSRQSTPPRARTLLERAGAG
ncbi:hypothetical protein FB451DRAFT_1390183 [Mycena latifolia]|nr:hypothetical protein FB451DRAFT_1390183 [Mycena latifolia]